MATSFCSDFFQFHLPIDLNKLPVLLNENACIVSVFGSNSYDDDRQLFCNRLLERNVFKTQNERSQRGSDVVGWYDKSKRLILLNCATKLSAAQTVDFLSKGNSVYDVIYRESQLVLYCLTVSHIVVCLNQGLNFDTSYIRLLKAIDKTRLNIPWCSEFTREEVSRAWRVKGRPTVPKMLFVFKPTSPLRTDSERDTKDLVHALEDRLYRLLKRTRVLHNNTGSSLFVIPANHHSVHIEVSNQSESHVTPSNIMSLFDKFVSDPSYKGPEGDLTQEDPILPFVMAHVNLALDKPSGFHDHLDRRSDVHVETVSLARSLSIIHKLFRLLYSDCSNSSLDIRSSLKWLKNAVNLENQFSERKCVKVMESAERDIYKKGLPAYYTQHIHGKQLAAAKQAMLNGGRGPKLQAYLDRLESECNRYWLNGHQLCEAISLSGNHCTEPLHRLPEDPISDENERLPCSDHTTQASFVVYCNCGNAKQNIGDPFELEFANRTVYELLAEKCSSCSLLESVKFPTYTPPVRTSESSALPISQSGIRSAKTSESEAALLSPSIASETQENQSDVQGVSRKLHNLHLDRVRNADDDNHSNSVSDYNTDLSQADGGKELSQTHSPVTMDTESHEDDLDQNDNDDNEDIELLDHMVTNASPRNALPAYSSWALTILGDYHSYEPKYGLEQDGFLSDHNYLLSWNISVNASKSSDPRAGDTRDGLPKRGGRKQTVSARKITTTIYIGVGYVCSQGHRFIMATSDKPVHVPNEIAQKTLTSFMPLYYICPSKEGCVGQLRYCYMVTPDVDFLNYSLHPKIQPAPVPCPLFLPTQEDTVPLLHNKFYVLRLPHFYADENGPYPLPSDQQSMTPCRLLKNAFHFENPSAGA